jgi:hypothetical protein
LVIRDLKGQPGELGLQASAAQKDFGVIYIGDTSKFKKLVEDDDAGITLEEDVVSESLFNAINIQDPSVNVLIGARKFTEGWNSWRVSSMCLLNIGRTEGSEVIQLFGRGVRLQGLEWSLKRSSALEGAHPPKLTLLETLNIFSVRASYMAQFRSYLEREGMDPDGRWVVPLPIRPNDAFLERGLLVPRLSGVQAFTADNQLVLAAEPAAAVTLDISPQIEAVDSLLDGLTTSRIRMGAEQRIERDVLDCLDYASILDSLYDYKRLKGFSNLIIPPDAPREILEAETPPLYRLVAPDGHTRPGSFREARLLERTATAILCKYVDKFFRVMQQRWETENMVYVTLSSSDGNFRDYSLKIPRSEVALIKAVEDLIAEGSRLYEEETRQLPTVHFDRHLYQPLLIQGSATIKSDPPGLGASEILFIEDLRSYVRSANNGLDGKELFVLRNLTRGKGVGFFEKEGFYPDFILWVREPDNQRVIFVEPHGMLHEKAYWTSDKTQLHIRLARLSSVWQPRSPGPKVSLDAYIISKTPYVSLREYYGSGSWTIEDFAEGHILFFEAPDYVRKVLM